MNMMRAAAEWLSNQHSQHLSETVVYRHFGDAAVVVEIAAVRGRTLFRAENEFGFTVRVVSSDFIVLADQIDFEPRKGDEIICDGIHYELLAPNNEPVWRWSDSDRKIMRIHTKEIGEIHED